MLLTLRSVVPCAYTGAGSINAPISFWCGELGTTACTASNESHFLTIVPSVATKILPSSTATDVTSTGSASTPVSSPATTSAPANANNSQPLSTAAVSRSTNTGTAVGLGVGLGVLFLACVAIGAWAYRLHRRQKEQFKPISTSTMQSGFPAIHSKPELNSHPNYTVHPEMESVLHAYRTR
jgi:hypothetical protein